MKHNFDSRVRLVAKVLRELIRTEHFEYMGDLKDVLYRRLSELHIAVEPRHVDEALSQVGSNILLVQHPMMPKRRRLVAKDTLESEPSWFTREEAAELLQGIRRR